MRNTRLKAIPCTISRGGFSEERVFTFELNGEQYKGIASRRHMWTAEGKPLESGEPPVGQEITGLVAARVLEVDTAQTAKVSIPDGEVVTLPLTQLVDRPSEVDDHVPV